MWWCWGWWVWGGGGVVVGWFFSHVVWGVGWGGGVGWGCGGGGGVGGGGGGGGGEGGGGGAGFGTLFYKDHNRLLKAQKESV